MLVGLLTIDIMDIVTFHTLYFLDTNNFSECCRTKGIFFIYIFH